MSKSSQFLISGINFPLTGGTVASGWCGSLAIGHQTCDRKVVRLNPGIDAPAHQPWTSCSYPIASARSLQHVEVQLVSLHPSSHLLCGKESQVESGNSGWRVFSTDLVPADPHWPGGTSWPTLTWRNQLTHTDLEERLLNESVFCCCGEEIPVLIYSYIPTFNFIIYPATVSGNCLLQLFL